ncbi:hypothetical protein DIPPA_32648 [Diplonema papillatum]|nr:hypothetical protein DIPPA_32648 [Diplonema papillatum]
MVRMISLSSSKDEKSVRSTPVVLGVEFDFAAKRYRLKQGWVQKPHLLFCSVD